MAYRSMHEVMDGFSVTEELPGPDLQQLDKMGGMEKYIDRAGKYKMEYDGDGFNIFRQEKGQFKKLNEKPLELL